MTNIAEHVKARFHGFQFDERINGYVPWFILDAPGYAQDQSTISLRTVLRYGIDVPKIPIFVPENMGPDTWVHYCGTCCTYFPEKDAFINHIRDTKDHEYSSLLVQRGTEVEYARPKDGVVYLRDEDKKEIDKREPVEEPVLSEVSSFRQRMIEKYPFLGDK